MRAIIIAGTHSGCGKTTMTLGILAALKMKGLVVQPFKAGPDFIDAGLHRIILGRPSRNLDQWMCGPEYVVECFRKHASDADIAVIEGVMGMHDGEFSTADLARLLQVPVLLVVDAYGMAESAGAVVKGFVEFGVRSSGFGVRFAGAIFNRVASENHYKRLKDSVRDVPVLGCLPRELNFEIPHRHLGLIVAEENPLAEKSIDRLAETVLKYVNIEQVIQSADLHSEGQEKSGKPPSVPLLEAGIKWVGGVISRPRFRLAVAHDRAFNFYYEDNLDLLRDAGAEIIRFSPLADPAIPDAADAVYIGGGYPELHAGALSRNTPMLRSIRAWVDAGRPIYAECGGLMYLSKGIHDFDNNFFAMAGVFPFETKMMRKPRLAYREIMLNEDCILGKKGDTCRGHEFHYSELIEETEARDEGRGVKIYKVRDNRGLDVPDEGFRTKNTLASYIHVHFGSSKVLAGCFAAFVKGSRTL